MEARASPAPGGKVGEERPRPRDRKHPGCGHRGDPGLSRHHSHPLTGLFCRGVGEGCEAGEAEPGTRQEPNESPLFRGVRPDVRPSSCGSTRRAGANTDTLHVATNFGGAPGVPPPLHRPRPQPARCRGVVLARSPLPRWLLVLSPPPPHRVPPAPSPLVAAPVGVASRLGWASVPPSPGVAQPGRIPGSSRPPRAHRPRRGAGRVHPGPVSAA